MPPTPSLLRPLAGLLVLAAVSTVVSAESGPDLAKPRTPVPSPAKPASRIPRDAFVLRPFEWIPGVPGAQQSEDAPDERQKRSGDNNCREPKKKRAE